ncbi:zonadhesin [Paralichthys olivaceus]|uniref:zonadhesin n=1 Tax=Paralichthys olivaceus TaxID=8255 RepID=UPI00375353FD
MCGLCGNISAVATEEKQSEWQPCKKCFTVCFFLVTFGRTDLCSACNSTRTAELASDNICGMLLSPAGSFGECHSAVDPEPFFQNCVNDLCISNGNEELFCRSLSEYTFACQGAGAEVKPWRSEKCSPSCPENSQYSICVSACPESCGISSDIHCPWPCYEGCQCESGYMQSGNGCIKPEQCGCFYHGHDYEFGEISWTEGCYTNSTMRCEPVSCPEGESCTLNNTWGCARKAMSCSLNSHFESCGTACPATCENPSALKPLHPGLRADLPVQLRVCVPLSQCGCNHNGASYHSNQTFWADEGCTEQCVCDPHTRQTRFNSDSCGPDENCSLQDEVRTCIPLAQKTCMYTGHHVITFDHHDYNLHCTCQYQLLGICEQKQGLAALKVHVQTDGHLASELHLEH